MSTLAEYLATRADGKPPRIVARSFWGFDPGWSSSIGFTLEANRFWFLENYSDGDLVLIYGADGEFASPANIGNVLGFIQVERRPIHYSERATEAAKKWLHKNNATHRWTFALPIRRAWRCIGEYELRQLAAYTFSVTEGRQRGSRGVILTDEETSQVLKLRVRPANVHLEERVYEAEEPEASPLFTFFMPSHALPPSGPRTIEDGPRCVYLSKFRGQPKLLLPGYSVADLAGKALVKVGLAKDASDRLASLNQGFSEASRQFGFMWEIGLESPSKYPSYEAAVSVEDELKDALRTSPDSVARSVGGEFFLADWDRVQSIFLRITMDTDRVIAASTRQH